jgi:hypothetical protein
MTGSQPGERNESARDGALTAPQVARYLLERDLLSPADVVDGDLRVRATVRRNLGFQVRGGAAAYLVKQAGGPDRADGLANEAAVYRWLAAAGEPWFLPRLYHHDPAHMLLVLELLPDAVSFSTRMQRGRFSTALAVRVGRALAWLHALPPAPVGARPRPCPPPWVLLLAHPDLNFYRQASAANLQLMRVVRQFPMLGQRLDDLWVAWQPARLVHYDLKWDNLLVVRAGRGRPRLKLVDWEMAGLGDPCWDAGAMLGEYLGCWATSIPANGEGPPDTLLALARYPLDRMQPAIRAFWQAYTAGLGLDAATALAWRGRAVRYAAVRLIQTAFEDGQTQLWLTNQALLLLQLAANILERPDEAAIYLLGLGPEAVP